MFIILQHHWSALAVLSWSIHRVATPGDIPDNYRAYTIPRFTGKKQSTPQRRKLRGADMQYKRGLEQHPGLFSGGTVIPYQGEK
jgi:hypothetical protein